MSAMYDETNRRARLFSGALRQIKRLNDRLATAEARLEAVGDLGDWLAQGTEEQRAVHRMLQEALSVTPDE
jgi:hypothetical protein